MDLWSAVMATTGRSPCGLVMKAVGIKRRKMRIGPGTSSRRQKLMDRCTAKDSSPLAL
jgi:hypothetical protein